MIVEEFAQSSSIEFDEDAQGELQPATVKVTGDVKIQVLDFYNRPVTKIRGEEIRLHFVTEDQADKLISMNKTTIAQMNEAENEVEEELEHPVTQLKDLLVTLL